MKKVFLGALSLCCLSLFGCDKSDFTGVAQVMQAFTVKNVDNQSQAVPAGSYQTKVTVDNKGVAKVRLQVGNDDNNSIRFLMNVQDLQNGQHVPADHLGQAFDLNATITDGQSQGPMMTGFQQCIYQTIYQQVCQVNQQGQQVCHLVVVGYQYGTQQINYYQLYQWKQLQGTLLQPGTSTVLANLNGREELGAQNITTFVSPCYP